MSMMNEGAAPPPDTPEYQGDEPDAAGAPDEKEPQQAVNYRAGTPIKNCGLCGHFTGSTGAQANGCETVDGTISAFGYCDIYAKQPNPFGDQHQYSMNGGQIAPAPAATSGAETPSSRLMSPPGLLSIGNKRYA